MIIGFDLDDVLLRFQDTLREYHNTHYGTNLKREDDNVWNLWERWKCTEEESIRRVREFYIHQDHINARPIDGSIEGINRLKKQHTLYVISAKPERLSDITMEWLNLHFPNTFDKVVLTNLFDSTGHKRKKSEVCKELGVDVFIEDAPHNAHDVANIGIPVLLLDYPWNQGEVTSPITRVFSWSEIVEKLT